MTDSKTLNVKGVHIGDDVDLNAIRDIVFPQHDASALHVAVDIGGSLAKVGYITVPASANSANGTQSSGGCRMRFARFETSKIEQLIAFLKTLVAKSRSSVNSVGSQDKTDSDFVLSATGGGAYKYRELLESSLGVTLSRHDEMECLIRGIDFLLRVVPKEVFMYPPDGESIEFESFPPANAYPYMYVNIGSGVSILKVDSETCFERVTGTSLGGGTYWGLMSLLSEGKSFEELLELSKEGNNENADLLVGDIYGVDYTRIGLKATTIASSFGKIFRMTPEERKNVSVHDIARSLLYMIANNIGQIAFLEAGKLGITRVYFGGYFICAHPVTMRALSFAARYWTKNTIRALFLRHEGYVGTVGAFMMDHARV